MRGPAEYSAHWPCLIFWWNRIAKGESSSLMWKNVTRVCLVAAVFSGVLYVQPVWGQEPHASARSTDGLDGNWALNRALSDDPGDQLQNVRGGGRPPAGSRPAPGSGSRFDAVRRAVKGFGIHQTDSTIAIAYPGRELVLFTDGRKQKIDVSEDLAAEYRAWWEPQGRLFIERKLDGGLTVTEQYSIQAGTGRLHVLTRLEGDRLPQTISFMRVYDPSESGSEG